MAVQISSMWAEPLHRSEDTFDPDLQPFKESAKFSLRLRKNLEESRRSFLNFQEDQHVVPERPKHLTKKISFKIKKTASIYRRKENKVMTTISANTVRELTKKYNELVEKNEPKIAKIVKRVNSLRDGKVCRKPSVRLKSQEEVTVKRKVSVKKSDGNKYCLRAKIGYLEGPQKIEMETNDNSSTVKAAIAIFEQKTKPKVPEKTFDTKKLALKNEERRLKILEKRRLKIEQSENKTDDIIVQVLNIPLIPPKKCDSRYETMQLKKLKSQDEPKEQSKPLNINPTEETIAPELTNSPTSIEQTPSTKTTESNVALPLDDYDLVQPPVPPRKPPAIPPKLPPKPTEQILPHRTAPPKPTLFPKQAPVKVPSPVLPERNKATAEEEIYEELKNYEDDDGYEICDIPQEDENIYETLPTPKTVSVRKQEPLPPRPPSRNSYYSRSSNIYESIYSKKDEEDDIESNYESIYGCRVLNKRDSLASEQQSNSIYEQSVASWAKGVVDTYIGKDGSELSASDRSDDWVDLSDHDNEYDSNSGFIIVRERQKLAKKTSGWSQQMREQWSKVPRSQNLDNSDSDSDHHYESLCSGEAETVHREELHDDDFDSFDSDSESDNSFAKNDSGVDMGNNQLPDPPNSQAYVLTRLAHSAGKHMKRLRRNWSLTKNDITKSLSRMTKRKSRVDLDSFDKTKEENPSLPDEISTVSPGLKSRDSSYSNVHFMGSQEHLGNDKTKSLGRKGFLNKFRRSMSVSGESPESAMLAIGDKPKSTFYLTETIDLDKKEEPPVVNLTVQTKTSPIRPQIPPPPAPTKPPTVELRKEPNSKRSSSWYAECGLFKNAEQIGPLSRRPNTFWYAEIGLYQSSTSTPSTSSAENSGSATNVLIKPISEDYYNMRNENDYYNDSIKSFDSGDTKKDEAFNSLTGELQLRLQDEPLYQFYDAAVLESVCQDGTSDFDYVGYEEVGGKKNVKNRMSRPTAMELVSPNRNSVSVARTLWCEIPEVVQSTVLSTLSIGQKKLQEAKFEMLTSEASYLNSLNVLTDHFVTNLKPCEFLTYEEKNILFSKIIPVKECSEKLLSDLENCWQDNILLYGVCDIVKKHADETFNVYVSYCENQILLDQTLKKLKDRTSFTEYLRQLESSPVCQLLTLHSFLMLPMQRVTRWPLLVDAVLKRLSPQDEEYLSCQYALATLNKIVNQCNEGARRMERVAEMQKIASQLEFAKGVASFTLVTGSRWLVRSGSVIHMQNRGDDIKLTFGKRFTKVPIHLFLFNDVLIVAKSKGDECYVVQNYCYRSYLEINGDTLACLPGKDAQGRHLIFLTILENHVGKTVELMLACDSESDKERWLEALSPPKSENPDETLYECWDCPQVTVVHNYTANQPDELALSRGDIINVLRKMADGWYHGERIRDGETGWFPANYTVEVANPHVRARNLKQRYRLLVFTENYLKSK